MHFEIVIGLNSLEYKLHDKKFQFNTIVESLDHNTSS